MPFHACARTHAHTHTEIGGFVFLAMSSRPSSRFLIARVILVVVTPGRHPTVLHAAEASGLPDGLQLAVVVLLFLLLHVVVVQVVVEEVRAAVLGGNPRLDAVLCQGGRHLDSVALRLRRCGQHLLPAAQPQRLRWSLRETGRVQRRQRRYLIISAYSLSLPLLSLHLRNMTDASTLAGEKVLGSLSREITLRRMVLTTTTKTKTLGQQVHFIERH